MEIKIPSYREIQNGKQSYIVYHIDIAFKEWKNISEKRYSEFYELYETMLLVKKIIKEDVPQIPSKFRLKTLFRKLNKEELEKRREKLEEFLRALEKSACAKHSKAFPDFIGLPLRFKDDWATLKYKKSVI